jgi:hypothetical protein
MALLAFLPSGITFPAGENPALREVTGQDASLAPGVQNSL